jgi:hypothetical protein
MSDLIFNAATHEYSVDGRILPSVTQVLQAEGIYDMSMIPEDRLRVAQQLGTAVHLATEFDDKGILDNASIDDVVRPYLTQWKKFKHDFDFELISSECRYYSEKYKYAGTLDRTCFLRMATTPRKCLLDIKTGVESDVIGLQLAAYQNLLIEAGGWDKRNPMVAVFLTPEKYKVKVFGTDNYFSIFLSALNIYNYKWGKK